MPGGEFDWEMCIRDRLDLGEKAMIGKGKRSKEVVDAIVRNHAVYFAAVGGCLLYTSQ